MEITKKYTMLGFLGEIECDGTIYISIPKNILQEEIDYRSINLMNLEKFTRKKQKRFIIESFFQYIPVMNLLLFGKKTKFDKLQVSWAEDDKNYEISFNFWDVIEMYPRDEYIAMEELIWAFQMIQNEAVGSDKVVLKKIKVGKDYKLHLSKVINNQVYDIQSLSNKIENKHSACWLMMQLVWTGSRIGLNEFSFKSDWI